MANSTDNHSILWTDNISQAADMFGFSPLAQPVGHPNPDWWMRLNPGGEGRCFEVGDLLPGWGGPVAQGAFVAHSGVSQYRVLRDILTEGVDLDHPLVFVAGTGENFEGQAGRGWSALAGNLHLSLALPCRLKAGPEALALTALPAVAVQRTLSALAPGRDGPSPGIKWANDVLVADRKVSGVLTYARTRGAGINAVVYGIGVNVAEAPQLGPSIFSPGATSLARICGAERADLGGVLRRLFAELVEWHGVLQNDGPAAIIEAYRSASLLTGRRVGIWPAETPDDIDPWDYPPTREGIVKGIGPDLALELEGQAEPVRSGRLAILAQQSTKQDPDTPL
jgi:biotin-(acetyl-CoA carboxylase) ligase